MRALSDASARSCDFTGAAVAQGFLLAQGAAAIRQRPTASFSAAHCLIKPLSEPVESEAKTCCPPREKKKENLVHGRSLFLSGCEKAAWLRSCFCGVYGRHFQPPLGSGSPPVPSAAGDPITVKMLRNRTFSRRMRHMFGVEMIGELCWTLGKILGKQCKQRKKKNLVGNLEELIRNVF